MIDMPPFDLDADRAREWLTPFTSQYEKGEYDWHGEGKEWYEMTPGSTEVSDDEDKKDR
jgi:hypothetical protein